MNRNCLFNKAIALLLCAVMLVGFLPSVAFNAAAEEWKPDKDEGPLDVFETTEAPTEPVGSKGNPEPIIDSATATLEENDDGYYYVYSNTVDGTLSVNVTTWDAYGYQYEITNKTAGGDPIVKKDESPATVKYTAGDEIVICVNTYMEETKPAGSVGVTVSFMQGWGTAEKPYILTEQNNSVAIPAGQQAYYRCYFGGTEMTVVAYGAYTLTVAGQAVPVVYDEAWESYTAVTPVTAQGRQPFDFAITNSTEGELSVDINFDYPEGSVNKPKEIYGTDSDTANIAAGSTGYYYSFFSAVNGTLTITVTADTAFMVDVNNYEFVKEAAAGETVTYTMEHTAQFNEDFDVIPVPVYVNTVNPESMWNNPAGNIKVDFSFVVGMGTQEEPFQLEEENTLTIPNGETYYYSCNFDGKIMTINGEAYALTINGGETLNLEGEYSTQVTMGDERIILIGLMNDSDAPITVVFSDPVGSMDNPEEIKLDTEYTHEFAAGDNGYFYTYTAEEDGNLIVSISGTNGWAYTINNMTTYAYGERVTSADENVVPEAVVPVSVGDEIVIEVTPFDAENPYSIPAGSVTIKVAYEEEEKIPTVTYSAMELSFDSEVKLWTYFYIDDALLNDEAAYMVVSKDGAYEIVNKTIYMSELVAQGPTGYGDYLIEMGLAGPELVSNVTYTFYNGEGEIQYVTEADGSVVDSVTRSALDYADLVFTRGTDEQKAIVTALLVYGGYAQHFFDVKEDNLAYNFLEKYDVAVPDLSGINGSLISQGLSFSGDLGIEITAEESNFDSAIFHRVFFVLTGGASIENITAEVIKIDAAGVTYKEEAEIKLDPTWGEYYVDITSIASPHLDHTYTIVLTDSASGETFEISTAVMSWVKKALDRSTDPDQINLAKATYFYNQAANEFFK